jgi:hypothetical protein
MVGLEDDHILFHVPDVKPGGDGRGQPVAAILARRRTGGRDSDLDGVRLVQDLEIRRTPIRNQYDDAWC